jgi:membrane-associated phospholipid phosphatase
MITGFTNFADQGVILPMIVLIALGLWLAGWRRAAIAWACVVPATLGVVLIGKMAVAACGFALPQGLRLHSPSGHTASAAVVYGGLLALVAPVARRRYLVLGCALTAAALFGASRLYLQLHTLADVMVGATIGVAGAAVLARLAGPRPARLRHPWWIATALVLSLLAINGTHAHAEGWVRQHGRQIWPFSMCNGPHR